MSSENGWIAVDLDGTLAHYDEWRGPDHIGEPIPLMVRRVKEWLDRGLTVKIFTARACIESQVPAVEAWTESVFGRKLEVTNKKDFDMISLYDDRCVSVIPNTGLLKG